MSVDLEIWRQPLLDLLPCSLPTCTFGTPWFGPSSISRGPHAGWWGLAVIPSALFDKASADAISHPYR